MKYASLTEFVWSKYYTTLLSSNNEWDEISLRLDECYLPILYRENEDNFVLLSGERIYLCGISQSVEKFLLKKNDAELLVIFQYLEKPLVTFVVQMSGIWFQHKQYIIDKSLLNNLDGINE